MSQNTPFIRNNRKNGWRGCFQLERASMRRLFAVLVGAVILAVAGYLIISLQIDTKDRLKVGIRSDATGVYDSDGVGITWVVENESDHEVHFDKGEIVKITVNGEPYAFEEDAVVLKPNEKYSVDIHIPYPVVREKGSNNIIIIATTKGGTVATYKETFAQ